MKRAIVLGGGGSKGAYQIGAWKALRELGIEYDIVTGTSIGACNGALMVQGDYDRAFELWQSIDIDKVVLNGLNLRTDLNYYMEHSDKLLGFLKTYTSNKGMDTTPLLNLLGHFIDADRFFASSVDYGLVSVRFPSMQPVQKQKDSIPKAQLQDWIMASCSCFPAFPIYEIDGEGYIDGGYYDNLPISLAFRLGAQEVIAIALNPKPHAYTNHPFVRCIQPKERLGGMLDFDATAIREQFELGYVDTLKSFGRLIGRDFNFFLDDMTTYTQGFAFALAEILRYELSTHTPQMLDRLVTQTPLYQRVMDLLTIDEDTPTILSLIESQMHLHAYKSTKIYHFTEIMPELVKKTQAYLLTRGLGGMTHMYDIEHLDDEALLAAIFLRVAS
ncbi:patatin-like phospholipase family protein [uncultured Helicobacter sp.]|uniref:patatin-like phospholipase family protein n=1 Tax=uncultured Helicobacter sp. TaxID=175537 RepID=UPI00374FBC0D